MLPYLQPPKGCNNDDCLSLLLLLLLCVKQSCFPPSSSFEHPGECAYKGLWAVQVTPRGVQLQLVGGAGEVVGDTLVMSNLGYFQLKAYPGVFQVQLAPGRTRQLYTIQSSTGVTEDAGAQVNNIMPFAGAPASLSMSTQSQHESERQQRYVFWKHDMLPGSH